MIFRPRTTSSNEQSASLSQDFHKDPLVGWLVIVSGPGKGVSLELGYGVNTIGRDREQRVSLDFGDEEISRKSHASVIYDQKSRRFFVQHGDGVNLTYVNDEPVLRPIELKGKEVISIGNTKLTFVPLCGSDFEWIDVR
jgi:pSer/pThr/pTyr-binding forkhead associated (FHA) protein